jgi:hypothetical protein
VENNFPDEEFFIINSLCMEKLSCRELIFTKRTKALLKMGKERFAINRSLRGTRDKRRNTKKIRTKRQKAERGHGDPFLGTE